MAVLPALIGQGYSENFIFDFCILNRIGVDILHENTKILLRMSFFLFSNF